MWNLPERTLEKTLRGSRDLPPSRIANVAMAFSRDAQRLAINFGESKRTEIFRRSDWEHPEGLNSAVLGTLGFTPRPNELVEVSKWNTGVELKAIDDSVARNVLQRGSWCFVDSDTSPDGRFLATCWSDPTALVFDLEQGSKSHELSGHARSVTCIRFSRDGRRLITASKDGTAIVWPVDVDAEAARRLPELTPPLLRILGLTQADLTPRVAQPAGSRE